MPLELTGPKERSVETIMMRHQKKKTMPGGFTLIELMIVVGILATLSAVAYPLINATLPRYRLRAAARELMIDFKKAKVEAIKRNKDVLIEFTKETVGDPNAGGSYLICADNNNNDACDAGEEIATVLMPRDARLKNTTFTTPADVTGYNSRGLPWESQLGTITLQTSDGKRTYNVALSMSGGVSM